MDRGGTGNAMSRYYNEIIFSLIIPKYKLMAALKLAKSSFLLFLSMGVSTRVSGFLADFTRVKFSK